jgi:hypothetical protein
VASKVDGGFNEWINESGALVRVGAAQNGSQLTSRGIKVLQAWSYSGRMAPDAEATLHFACLLQNSGAYAGFETDLKGEGAVAAGSRKTGTKKVGTKKTGKK